MSLAAAFRKESSNHHERDRQECAAYAHTHRISCESSIPIDGKAFAALCLAVQ